MASLRILTPSDLRAAATIPDAVVAERWRTALSRNSPPPPPLVSVFDDWSEFSGSDHRTMLLNVQEAQDRIDAEWKEIQTAADPDAVATFYDETDTLIPLLAWWHGTDLNPARCAVGASAVLHAVGGHQALDFGCGIGSTALALAAAGADVVLADVATDPLSFAEWRMRLRGHEPIAVLNLRERSLADLEPASCDAVVAFDVFEHLPDPYPSLEQLDRLLAPSGLICLNQAYVPMEDEAQHYPQRGETLMWLHRHGYRLAHVTSVCWVAQKAPLPRGAHLRQAADLRMRIGATQIVDGRGPLSRRLGSRVIRHALR